MKKNELKKMLKPLIKECIKEVIFEEGALSTIISEVMKGVAPSDPGVDISSIFSGHSANIWQKLSGKD